MQPYKIDSETFLFIFFVLDLYGCILFTYTGGCDRFLIKLKFDQENQLFFCSNSSKVT